MLCVKADDLGNMKENDEGGFMKVLGDAQFSVWKLRCRARADTYQDDTRVRVSVVDATPVDYGEEAWHLGSVSEEMGKKKESGEEKEKRKGEKERENEEERRREKGRRGKGKRKGKSWCC